MNDKILLSGIIFLLKQVKFPAMMILYTVGGDLTLWSQISAFKTPYVDNYPVITMGREASAYQKNLVPLKEDSRLD